ncbi:putative 3-hydroxyacyl-CoA dehydrogenase [Gordonia paraffinivorans NBRC 108238]|uniref:3-hydroxyacyl-CoA dehydrogenase n=1 Tax=Gordonia paraffinivorans NBRC 108238 TaxID=1223543 RepID=A0ABQ0IMK9_9ACTN|nr:3-hydroxyacyl-CoA dehydrogenase [Gordonia paraffinivorans]MCD2146942.1 3-hydroxyacyl-CoA dehydrogenase [Gordonia paraffinivorans]GAC84710.1 putative 3-hydroxyacyl-CoA dehydrogenase [Gordonia paraffinivorans NBRC 108238]
MNISGSSALVTGGASGLGLATAEKLSGAGAKVVIVDLPESPGAEVADRSENITFVPADVRDSEQISAAIETASALAPLRITVNCAGIGDPAKTLGRRGPLGLDRFERVISINLLGTFNVIRLAAEAIAATEPVEGERGVIVNTASVAAFDGQVGQASYSASKAAIAGMTLPVARDLADLLIRVVTIAPGMFATPILQGLTDDARASLEKQIPHPSRLGQPAEYADLVAHIVNNPMLNGETIRLDGALRMAPR